MPNYEEETLLLVGAPVPYGTCPILASITLFELLTVLVSLSSSCAADRTIGILKSHCKGGNLADFGQGLDI